MHNKQLSNIYSNRVSTIGLIGPDRFIVRVLKEADNSTKKYSKKELATIISSKDIHLSPGTCGKDVRIQPIGEYDPKKFPETLQQAELEVIKVSLPGEEGSTSGQLRTYIVQDINGNEYSVVLGKGKGFGTVDEDIVLEDLRDQIKALLIENDVDYITININGYHQKVDGVKSTPGTPKSDFNFTFKGKNVLFISHKAGTKARHHQQYGGTTCTSGKEICEHPEVKNFVQMLKQKYPDRMPPGSSNYLKIEDNELKKLSVFGMDYGKEYGNNNVNVLLQGRVEIVPDGDEYKLTASHIVYNGDLPIGPYEPVLYARYSGSRGGNHGIKDLRSMITPIGKISSNTQDIKLNKANIAAIKSSRADIENLL